MAQQKEIAVMGAGLVGSLLSVYLAKEGHKVTVYERRPDMRKATIGGGRSINLALSDRGWKALSKVGADQPVREMGIPMYGRMIHHEDGTTSYQPYGKDDQAIYSVSRSGLNAVLMDYAEQQGVAFSFEEGCDAVDMDSRTAHLSSGKQVTPDLLFGADGAFSRVRLSMMKTDRFDYSQQYLPHGYKELSIPPAPDGSWLIEKEALHIWPRHDFMLIALPNLDGSFTCTLFAPFEGPNGFNQVTDSDSLMAYFNQHFADAVPLMPTLETDYFTNPTASLVTVRCYPWVRHQSIALIGDASHAIVPFYGQGMNSGFEDCDVLHQCMVQYGDDWPAVLAAYQESRKPSADAIADLALQNFIEMRDRVDDPAFLYRKQLEKRLHEKYPSAFVPQYTQVTFSHLPYEKALAAGKQQEAFFDQIIATLDIQQAPDDQVVESVMHAWQEFFT